MSKTGSVHYVCATALGRIHFTLRNERLVAIELPGRAGPPASRPARSGLAREVARQLQAFGEDPRFVFDLPIAPDGTRFQRRVWAALRAIPAGEVKTYGEVARTLGSVARAVGGACRANPLPLVVPCHRVIATGGLGGFAGNTTGPEVELKRRLLAREGARLAR